MGDRAQTPAAVTHHRLGFVGRILSLPKHKPYDARKWQSEPNLETSLDLFSVTVDWLVDHDIRAYRIPDGFVPYGAHPGMPQFQGQVELCADRLAEVGERLRAERIRVTNHPGQYTVLNSERPDIQLGAIADLELHTRLFDAMGLDDDSVIVLHVGGSSGGFEAAGERFLQGVAQLSERARARLVIEHDDRVWSLSDVLPIAERAGLRVVFDNLHHYCLDRAGLTEPEAAALAVATWPDGTRPKVHASSPRSYISDVNGSAAPKLPPASAHADLLDPIAFTGYLRGSLHPIGRDIDVMVEAKGKDLAVLRLREQLVAHGEAWVDGAFALD